MENIVFDLGGVLFARDRSKCTQEFHDFFSFIRSEPMPAFWEDYDRGVLTLDEVTGILSGVGAKELVVSTLGVLYADDAEADAVSLGERIPITPLVAFGYMVFVLIYFPCIATLAAIKGESGSWKWAVFAGLYTTALAWLMSFAIYQIGGLFL